MARKQPEAVDARETTYLSVRRGLLIVTFASIALLGVLWSAWQLEHFLIRDPQFTVALPPDPGEESPALNILGVQHSARSAVSDLFDHDYGRSLYLVPVRQRREQLLRLQWVKDATVTRVWPNRVRVHIVEREPVAFLQLPQETALPLIDIDGHILPQEAQEPLKLPVLLGLTREQTPEQRSLRVKRMAKLMRDAGPLADKISEVDATDPDNLRVMQDAGGKAVTLILGNRQFRRRLEKFRQNYEELLRRSPEKTTFDLRVEGSIFARSSQIPPVEGVRPSD